MIHFRDKVKFDKQAVVVFISQNQLTAKRLSGLPNALNQKILQLNKNKHFKAENGDLFPLIEDGTLILLVGLGKKEQLSLTGLRITARKAFLSRYLKEINELEVILDDHNDQEVEAVIEAVVIGTYEWSKYKTKNTKQQFSEKEIYLIASKKKIFEDTIQISRGVNFTRDLINDNADTVTAVYLEKTVKEITKGKRQISLEILGQKDMEKVGLGLHLAVNQGSRNEPRLIIVKYNGASKKGDYTALVGKGMTYDTGGLNLKPTGSIETMKSDMSGAAAVIGALRNAIALSIKKNVIFVMSCAENAIGSGAFKPGDVIKGYAGKTVEIANTDAEGRLVLADAIAYVVKNYKPARIIDIATLTGACVVALGHDYTGLIASDDKFARQLVQASNNTDDRVWRLLPSFHLSRVQGHL